MASVAAGQPILIEDVTVVSSERTGPLAGADVLIRDGRIAAVGRALRPPPNARRIDGRGKFLVPGLIDSHVHVGAPVGLTDAQAAAEPRLWEAYKRQVPRTYLAFGFTTVVDLNLDPATKAWFEAAPQRPRLYHCGPAVGVAGGYGARKLPPEGVPGNLVYEPAAAKTWPTGLDPAAHTPQRAVGRAADAGAICVKVFVEPGFGVYNWPVPSAETLRGLRRAATERRLVMMTHATGADPWRWVAAARTDVIVHGLWVWPGDRRNPEPSAEARQAIAEAARAGVRVQPTLQVIRGEGVSLDRSILTDPRLDDALPRAILEPLRARKPPPQAGVMAPVYASLVARTHATFRLMREARIPLILGSDTPAGLGDNIGNPPGLNGRLEMESWAKAGATPAEILRAATLENARAMGLSRELGTIERGKRADLLLLGADPLADVAAYNRLEIVFVGGEPIPRETLRPRD